MPSADTSIGMAPAIKTRALCALTGLGLLGAGLGLPGLRDAEGALATPSALVLSGGAGLWVLAALAGRLSGRALGLFGLFLIGGAARLQLDKQGPTVSYQHLFPPGELASGRLWWAELIVAVQLLVVGAGLIGAWPRLRARLAGALKPWQWAGIAGVFVLTSSAVSKDPTLYVLELAVATALQLLTLANLGLAVAALDEAQLGALRPALDRLFGAESESSPRRRFDPVALAAAGWVLVAAVALNFLSYGRHPHVPDEVVYLYPAKYFAAGKLWVALPRAARAFNVDLMFYDAPSGRMWSPVPLGWPLVLALGQKLGVPWLVNPLLGAGSVLLWFGFVRRLLGAPAARLATLLVAASPWFVFLSMSFMTHASSLFAALVASYCVIRLRDGGHGLWNLGWALLGGAGIGYVSLVRPLEGMAVASVLGLWVLTFRPFVKALLSDALLALATGAVAAIALPYNKLFTGDPLYFPIMHYTDTVYGKDSNAMGFGPNRGLGWPGLDPFPGHGLADVIVNSNLNLYAINVELFGWGTGSIGLLALLWFSRRMRAIDWAASGAAFTILFAHAFYWFAGGPDFGARYWCMTFFPLILLAVRAVMVAGELTPSSSAGSALAPARLQLAIVALCLGSTLNFVPWRAIDKYHHFRGMRPGLRELSASLNPGRALFLVRGKRHPDYASAFVLNPVDFDGDAPIYAWEQGPEITAELLAAYPDRPVYVVNGPSVTGADFQLLAGPITAGEVPALLAAGQQP